MRATIFTGLIGLVMTGSAFGQGEGLWGEEQAAPEPWMLLGPGAKSTSPPLQQGFPNGSFEEVDVSGHPLAWGRTGAPTLRTGGAADGQRHAWVQMDNRYHMFFAPSIAAWQTFTAGASVMSELGSEGVSFFVSTPMGSQQDAINFSSVRGKSRPPGQWAPMFGAFTRLPDTSDFLFMPRSLHDVAWVGFDDFFILLEEVRNGDFESEEAGRAERERWQLSTGAALVEEMPLAGARSLRLQPGASASRLLAHTPHAVQYFVAGRATGNLVVTEERLDVGGDVLEEVGGIAPPESGRFFLDFGRTEASQAARLRIRNETAAAVTVDDLSRGFAYAWPQTFEPVENSPRPTVRLAAAWPGRLHTASIVIRDEIGTEVLQLNELIRDDTSVWLEFDGGGLPAGDYTAEFVLLDAGGVSLRPTRDFTLRRPPAFPESPTPIKFDNFQAMPWIFHNGLMPEASIETADEAEAWLRDSLDDGFTLPLLLLSPSQFAPFLEATERVGAPYVVGSHAALITNSFAVGNATFDPGIYLDRLEVLRPFMDSPLCVGVYIADEPNIEEALLRWVERTMLMMEEEGRNYPPAYSFLSMGAPSRGANFPLLSAHFYPYFHNSVSSADALLDAVQVMESDHVAVANQQGLDFWAGTQGFARIGSSVPATPAEAQAQLGTILAIGSRGYHAFLYSTVGTLGGLRTHLREETPRLEAYRQFNARTAALNALLRELPSERSSPPQTNLLARVAVHPSGDHYAFVVNVHPDKQLNIEVETNAIGVMRNVETGLTTAPATLHNAELGPGDWSILHFMDAVPVRFDGTLSPAFFEQPAAVSEIETIDAGAAPLSLEISPDGRWLAVLANAQLRLYSMQMADFGMLRSQAAAGAGPGTVRFIDNATVVVSTRRFGLRAMNVQPDSLVDIVVHQRETAVAMDAVRDGNLWWTASSFFGVSLFEETEGGGLNRLGIAPSDHSWYVSMHGPYSDGSVIAIEDTHGPHRVWLGESGPEKERMTPASLYAQGSTSPSGRRLAIGRLDRGVVIFELNEDGSAASQWELKDEGLNAAEKTAWLDENILAVADARRGLRFYRLHADQTSSFLGVWEPQETFAIESLSAGPNGKIALGMNDGTIYLGNASELMGTPNGSLWMLLGDENSQTPTN